MAKTMSLNVKDYLEIEAEEGSENEKNDYLYKNNKNEDEESEDLDTNLGDLLDEYVPSEKIKKDRKVLRNKFIEDELIKDNEEIKQIMEAKYRKKRKWSEIEKESYEGNKNNNSESQILKTKDNDLGKRKKIVHSTLISGSQETKTTKFGQMIKNKVWNVTKYKKFLEVNSEAETLSLENENPNSDEEVNNMLNDYEQDIKKKLAENSSGFKRKFTERLKENKMIMENVIDLNKMEENKIKNNLPKMKRNQFLPYKISQSSQNSVLNAMKNDKYYPSNNNLISQKLKEENLAHQPNQNNFSVFNNRNNLKLDTEKKQKISAIFDKSDRSQIIKLKNPEISAKTIQTNQKGI